MNYHLNEPQNSIWSFFASIFLPCMHYIYIQLFTPLDTTYTVYTATLYCPTYVFNRIYGFLGYKNGRCRFGQNMQQKWTYLTIIMYTSRWAAAQRVSAHICIPSVHASHPLARTPMKSSRKEGKARKESESNRIAQTSDRVCQWKDEWFYWFMSI